MFKKCLIFLFILSISYLFPINSKAQSGLNQLGPAKDVCSCQCETGTNPNQQTIYVDDKCTDRNWDFKDILDETQCKNKDGQPCRGYLYAAGDINDPNDLKCTGGFNGILHGCRLIGIPD